MKVLLITVMASWLALTTGCLGTAHGYRCYGAGGRYFRATRMNYDILVGRESVNESVTVRNGIETVHPGWSFPVRLPFVAIDLPFSLVLDTVLVPFIATGVVKAPRDLRPEDVPWTEYQEVEWDAQPQEGGYSLPAARSTKHTPERSQGLHERPQNDG